MRIEHMRRILAIVDEGGISHAAKKLYISQPTLSQMVKTAEEKLGTPIFERQAKELKLTFAGERFVVMARKIVSSWDSMVGDLQEIREGTRDKIVTCLTLRRGISYLSVVLPQLLEKYPAASVEQVTIPIENQEMALMRRTTDVVIGSDPIVAADIKTVPLLPEHYMLIASRKSEFAERFSAYSYQDADTKHARISIRDAAHERFILPNPTFASRQIFNKIAQEANVTPSALMEVTNIDMAVGMVRANLGVSILPVILTSTGRLCNRSDQLCYFLLDSPYTTRAAYLCYDRSTYLSTVHMEFIRLMYENFCQPPH